MSVTIRPMTTDDDAAVQAMAARFLSNDGPYRNRFVTDPARLSALLARMATSGDDALALVAVDGDQPVGMFAMFWFEHPIVGLVVAAELCWWMEPETRGGRAALRMLRTGEGWARDIGADLIEIIAPTERVGQFYERLGYQRTDIHYMRAL